MATVSANSSPISLYFQVPHNQAVSLDVIGRSMVAWDELIKELASVADPSLSIQVDFLSGTVGSRSINSIIRTAAKVAVEHPWTSGSLAALAGVFLLAPPSHVANDLTNHIAKEWFDHEDNTLSDQDVERVAQRVVQLQRDNHAIRLKKEIITAADRDERVTGVGATPKIATPPSSLIIPRTQFQEHGSEAPKDEPVETRFRVEENERVVIVRPYSKAEERRWRFEGRRGEFSATMRDPIFLEALRTGHTGIEIGEGIEMRVDLRIKEELVDGEWEEKEFEVTRVVHPNVNPQSSMQFSPDKPDEPDS